MDGMKAAVLAAQNETGDSTVTLECEVSKNFIKCSTYLSESGNLSKVEATPVAGLATAPPIKACTSQDDNQPEMYYMQPMMRWTTCNGEQINEQVSGQENVYYTNPIRSLDSSPIMCYVHPSTMHPIYVDSWKPQDHRVVAQHQGSYQPLMTGEYVAAETQVPMCQQMVYPYVEQQPQQWAYMQVNSNHVVTEVTTEADNSGATSPSLSCDHAPSGSNLTVLEDRMALNHAECISYGDGPTMDQGSHPTQVQAHLTRTYPPYQGQSIHPGQMQQQMQPVMQQMQPVIQQKHHFVYQSLSMSSSPQLTTRVFYPAQAPTTTRQFDDGQLCFSPDVPQTVFYHEPAYPQHVYSSPVPYQIQSSMSMTYPPSPSSQQTQYPTPFMSIVESHCNYDHDQARRQPFRKKATATLQRFKALV